MSCSLPTHRVRSERLLAVLHVERRQLHEIVERFVGLPALVHVDLHRETVALAHRAHALDVETVPPAELQLQPLETRIDLLGAARHVVGIAEPDRPRGRRP